MSAVVTTHVTAHAVPGLPEVETGADLARLVLDALAAARLPLLDGDVLVVSSKVVSKAAGLVHDVDAAGRDAVVVEQTRRPVAARRTPRGTSRIVESLAGPVMAAAGVDASNTRPGTVLTLPADPDGAARSLRADLRRLGAPLVAVVVSDTAGRPWRRGQTDLALGCAGLDPVDDLRGTVDASGQPLEVTERALADEVASTADLVKGKASGVPVALVRGLAAHVTDADGPGAASVLRDPASDWFRLGHVEAVRASLGVPQDLVEEPSVLPEPLLHRAIRATKVAASIGGANPLGLSFDVVASSGGAVVTVVLQDDFTAGVVVTRLLSALWAEDLSSDVDYDPSTRIARVLVQSRSVTGVCRR